MRELAGKAAFVTGGTSGLGLALVKVLAAEGMKVTFTYRREEIRNEVMAYFSERPEQQVLPVYLDVTDRAGFIVAADESQRHFGPVQLLINNAGVGLMGPMERATYDDWDWVLGINLGGVINSLVTFLPRMVASGLEGHIVNVSSMAGIATSGQAGLYGTSKFALVGLTESLRTDLANRNIGVSVFCPGVMKSNIHIPRKRSESFTTSGFRSLEPIPGTNPPLLRNAMDPISAAQHVLRGVRNNDLFILSHPEYRALVATRHAALMASMPELLDEKDAERAASTLFLLSNAIYATPSSAVSAVDTHHEH